MNVRKLLVATDFSNFSTGAARYAVSLSQDTGARLYAVHVVQPPPYGPPVVGGLIDQNSLLLNEMLDEMIPTDASVEHESHTLVGDPATEIVRFARDEQIDLIIIGTHGRSGLTRVLMGSVAESVMRNAPCPVLTVKQTNQVLVGDQS